ncbi:MAG TPA: FtsX-like permease family protein, partial [Candidatus Elarobacter sp.]|nr:FtsX-like permease family protein [Candidatus Elarobacter sp.]
MRRNTIFCARTPDYGLGTRIPPAGLRHASLIVWTPGTLDAMAQWLRAEIHRMEPALPVDIATLEQRVRKLAQRPKFSAVLLAFFAVTALLSAAVGLYGLVSFFVVQRTREIGIRMALGATRPSIVRLVLRHAAGWAITGLLIGMGGATLMAGTLRSLLFHVGAGD